MVPVRTASEYATLLRASPLPSLAQLEAPWCGECHSALPELETIAAGYRDRLTVLRLDADRDRALRDAYQVQGYPTYLFAENGRVRASCYGEPEFGLTRLVELLLP